MNAHRLPVLRVNSAGILAKMRVAALDNAVAMACGRTRRHGTCT
jgi:hypothetical protein